MADKFYLLTIIIYIINFSSTAKISQWQNLKTGGLMRLLGNIIWLLLGGWVLFLVYSLAAIIFFPIFIPLFRLAKYSLWPFGKGVITQSQLKKYKALRGSQVDEGGVVQGISGVLNIVWMLTFGWWLALGHFFAAIANLFLFFLIVTIPNISGHWKMIRVAFMPFNKVVVPQEVVDEIELAIAKGKLDL
tara:strand:+ start:52 stop:618 length:567 start_codon:yes stop_codon:yes gene_type:complete